MAERRAPRWTLLRYPDYGRLWLGHGLSLLGGHLSTLALPLLVLEQTGSATAAGLVGTARMLAYLVSSLPAGALADRLPRRAALVLADLVRAAVMLAVGVALWSGSALPIVLVIGAGVVDTVVSAVAGPAGTATLRHLVPAADLPRALALDTGRGLALGLIGPLLGGVLYQVAPALPFLLDAVTYGFSLALVLAIRRRLGGGGGSAGATLRADIADGVRFVLRSRFIVLYLVWAALMNFATAGITFGLVVVIGPADAAGLGVAMTVLALGGIVGTAIAPRLSHWDMQTLVRLSTASSVAVGVVITLAPHPVVIVACVGARSLLAPAAGILFNAQVFALVPDAMTARVQSTLYLVGGAFYPFATLAAGWLCEWRSPSFAFAVFTVLLGGVLALTLLPSLRMRSPDQPGPVGHEDSLGAVAGADLRQHG
ncbi:MFS transporter [Actinoplanes sp. NPDC049599]|uniref:MFS transporter n=1 Tax=Actinoplanes sp. NPDC049599 TaxID=3363903 RepID=UPI0037B08B94